MSFFSSANSAQRRRCSFTVASSLVWMCAVAFSHAGTTGFELNWHTIDAGGGTSSSASFELSSTIGQPDAGYSSSASFAIEGGFWVSFGGPVFVCLGDMVTSATFQPPPDGQVDGADLAFMLGAWGANPGSPADIVTSATFQPPPDGQVDGADLAFLLGAWGPCE